MTEAGLNDVVWRTGTRSSRLTRHTRTCSNSGQFVFVKGYACAWCFALLVVDRCHHFFLTAPRDLKVQIFQRHNLQYSPRDIRWLPLLTKYTPKAKIDLTVDLHRIYPFPHNLRIQTNYIFRKMMTQFTLIAFLFASTSVAAFVVVNEPSLTSTISPTGTQPVWTNRSHLGYSTNQNCICPRYFFVLIHCILYVLYICIQHCSPRNNHKYLHVPLLCRLSSPPPAFYYYHNPRRRPSMGVLVPTPPRVRLLHKPPKLIPIY